MHGVVFGDSNRAYYPLHVAPDDGVPEALIPVSQSTSAIFDHAFDLVKANFATIILTVAILLLPTFLMLQYAESKWLSPAMADLDLSSDDVDIFRLMLTVVGYILVGSPKNSIPGLLTLAVCVLVSAPVAFTIGQLQVGQKPSISSGYKIAVNRGFHVLTSAVIALSSCITIGIPIFATLFIFSMIASTSLTVWLTSVGLTSVVPVVIVVLFVITLLVPYFAVCLFFGRFFAFTVCCIVTEKTSILESMAHSCQLAKSVSWKVTITIFAILPLMVLFIQYAMGSGFSSAISLLHLSPQWNFIASTGFTALITCVLQAFWMVFIALLYYDYRVKRECFDIRLLSAAVSLVENQ